jgi:hypothetical protein
MRVCFVVGGQPQQSRLSIQLPDGSPCRLDRMLATANAKSAEDCIAFLDALELAIPKDVSAASSFLLVGATGGVRAGLHKGSVSDQALSDFEGAVVARFGGRFEGSVSAACISGADEGRWELAAAQAIWGGSESTVQMFGQEDTPSFVGVLSGGGTTMQIGTADHIPQSYPFTTMWDEMDETKAAPAEAWLDDTIWDAWEGSLLEGISRAFAPTGVLSKGGETPGFKRLGGCFIGTACNFQAVEGAGFAERAVTAQAAAPMLRAAIGEFRKREGVSWEREKDKPRRARYNWFRVMSMQMCRLAHVLDAAFEPAARLYFTKKGLTPAAAALECEWTLGCYMEKQKGRRVARTEDSKR